MRIPIKIVLAMAVGCAAAIGLMQLARVAVAPRPVAIEAPKVVPDQETAPAVKIETPQAAPALRVINDTPALVPPLPLDETPTPAVPPIEIPNLLAEAKPVLPSAGRPSAVQRKAETKRTPAKPRAVALPPIVAKPVATQQDAERAFAVRDSETAVEIERRRVLREARWRLEDASRWIDTVYGN